MRCFSPEGIALASPDLQASLRQHQSGNLDAAIAGYRAYRMMWQRHVAGLAPEAFVVPAEA